MDNEREKQRIKRQRVLGSNTPQCRNCDETNPHALTGTAPNIGCYECHATAGERSPVEAHHPAGQHNAPETVEVPGNDHRVLSADQQLWPTDTLRNPNGSPLLRAAAAIRGWLDVLRLIIDRTVGWVPAFLESLDKALHGQLGNQWWDQMELDS